MAKMGIIYSTSLVTSTFWGGAFVVLLPIGMARGVIQSVQEMSEIHGNAAIQQTALLLQKGTSIGTTTLLSNQDGKQILETLTGGSGWQGQVLRTLAGPFLPSTAQMMARLQESIDLQKQQTDGQVIAAAAGGLVEGFLQDKKDTITMVGGLGYIVWLGIGFGVDYTYRRAAEKTRAIQDKSQEQVDKIHQQVKKAQEALESGYEYVSTQNTTTSNNNVKETVFQIFQQTMDALKDEKNKSAVREIFGDLMKLLEQVQQQGSYLFKETDIREMQDKLMGLINQQAAGYPNGKDLQEMQQAMKDSITKYQKKLEEQKQQMKLEEKLEQTKAFVKSTQMANKAREKWQEFFGENNGK
eukprot:CAMPEP_0198154088 /NCGR_PEP_ID=MMETSP1443-20131203/67200_1 /TAXON_ID=186043 /ORGANISM="Entomoneis sp., Strain CCMP2396" /LENGTH=354 /DNA_ID=CAMNT_0043820671 /DNA_START=42 /DNA_END=1106 /DNA_ORIENTATION=-